MKYLTIRAVAGLSVVLLLAGAALAVEKQAYETSTDPAAMCAEMMKDGATSEGGKAMREFMKSERAPQAMANMMEMARRMGNGDVMLGMTRMMDMMGSMGGGGMMDGHGMAQPGGARPGK
jgi:hypothetical protein